MASEHEELLEPRTTRGQNKETNTRVQFSLFQFVFFFLNLVRLTFLTTRSPLMGDWGGNYDAFGGWGEGGNASKKMLFLFEKKKYFFARWRDEGESYISLGDLLFFLVSFFVYT